MRIENFPRGTTAAVRRRLGRPHPLASQRIRERRIHALACDRHETAARGDMHGPSFATRQGRSQSQTRVFMSDTRGFTLLEIMWAMIIVGIVMVLAMPGYGRFRAAMSLKQANAQILQDVRRARQLAVTRHAPVVVRFGAPPTISNITSYTIHVDTNGDHVRQSTELMPVRNLPNGTRLSAVTLTPIDSLRFDTAGLLLLTAAGTPGGRIVMANRLNRRDTLLVSAAGVCYQP